MRDKSEEETIIYYFILLYEKTNYWFSKTFRLKRVVCKKESMDSNWTVIGERTVLIDSRLFRTEEEEIKRERKK